MIKQERLLLKGEIMNLLIIDCSTGMKLYLIKNNEEFVFVDENQKRHTDTLLSTVDDLFTQAGLSVKDLDCIGVCVGPGSFTGIRVAVSICKGLSVESKIKVVVATNFDIYQFNEKENYALVLEGFSDYVYVREKFGEVVNDLCVAVDEFANKLLQNNNKAIVYVQNDKIKESLNKFNIESQIAKNDTISLFKYKINNKIFSELNKIEPIYLRASQAEIERNKKLGKEV